jgi:hypothetical protein
MSQKIQRKQTRNLLSRDRFILSVLLLVFGLWPQSKIAQAQWTDNGNNLTTSDNVGIGTASPLTKLHVEAGDLLIRSTSNPRLRFGHDDNITYASVYRESSTGKLFIRNDQGQPIILDNGNVGIGTTVPSVRLEVSGNQIFGGQGIAGANSVLTHISSGEASSEAILRFGYWYNAGSYNAGIWDIKRKADNSLGFAYMGSGVEDPTKSMYISSSGNVGIGTTSPAAKLHVAGGSGSDVAIDALGKLIINNGAGGNNYIVASTNTANPRMDFYTASAHRMTVDYGGNVGIGTTAPSVRLEVSGNQVFGGQGIAGANSVLTHISSGEIASEAVLRFGYWYSPGSYNAGIWDIKRKADNSLGFAYVGSGVEDSTKSMYISSSGNVGIGTMNPSTKLEVAGDIAASGNIAAKYQDVAEWVTSPKSMPAGTIVILDTARINQVLPSVQAYDTRVAGVVSDMPGILLGEAGDGKVKVATTGRVKVKVDATKKPIQVGDLLVTSDKEGVAMKSEPMEINGRPFHQPGTILGKALEPLKEGEGEILVLLSMQ